MNNKGGERTQTNTKSIVKKGKNISDVATTKGGNFQGGLGLNLEKGTVQS